MKPFFKKINGLLALILMLVVMTGAANANENGYKDATFDECGPLSQYQDQIWYADLEKHSISKEVIHACFSENGHLLIMLIPAEYGESPGIYRFDTQSLELEKALFKDHDLKVVASPNEFGEKQGYIFHLKGIVGDAGGVAIMYFEYNFVRNTFELKAMYTYETYNPESGEWHVFD